VTNLDLSENSEHSEQSEQSEHQASDSTKETSASVEKKAPSYIKVTIANLVCPGYGAWILGERGRGALIFLILMAILGLYVAEVQDLVFAKRDEIQKVVRAQHFERIEGIVREVIRICLDNLKLKLFAFGYLFSMLDSLFLVYNMKKEIHRVT
jgi:hypothetical protein